MIGLAPWKMFGDKWLTTRGAAKLFFLGTLLVPALAIQVFGGIVVPQLPRWERTLWGMLDIAIAAGGIFLWFGMLRYWMRFDDSRVFAKRIWFPIVLLGAVWGSFLYYYCVYLPQVLRAWKEES